MAYKTDTTDTRREPLTRERIVGVAMEIADREGLDALSMRRVAAALDATPMALYNHFADKDELLAAISSRLVEEVDLSGIDPSDWAASIKSGYSAFRDVLLRHPNLIPVMQRKVDASVEAHRPIELSLSLLRSAGLSPEEAIWAHWTLTGYTMGHVVWQLMSPLFQEGATGEVARHRDNLPIDEFPLVHECLHVLEEGDMDTAWEYGLDAIIEGLKAKIAARA